MKIFNRGRRGASLVEYGALVGFISVAAIYSIYSLGDEIRSNFVTVETELAEKKSQTRLTVGLPGLSLSLRLRPRTGLIPILTRRHVKRYRLVVHSRQDTSVI